MSRNAPATRDLSSEDKAVQVAQVVHHEGALAIPVGMSVRQAIGVLERRESYLQEVVEVNRTFNVFPFDGANALNICLAEKFGWASAEATPGWFGDEPPQMLTIEVGYGQTRRVPWGRFSLPGVEGFLQTTVQRQDGRICFAVSSTVRRKAAASASVVLGKRSSRFLGITATDRAA